MVKKSLNPPVLSNVDEIDSWLNNWQIWEFVTNIEKQLCPVIYLSLAGKARSARRDTAVADLKKDDGLNVLINKLETLYVKDKKASPNIAYERLETFQHPSDMNITDYLNEFERLYNEI